MGVGTALQEIEPQVKNFRWLPSSQRAQRGNEGLEF